MSLNSLSKGFYTFAEAARFTLLRKQRVSEWFRVRSNDLSHHPIFHGDHEPVAGNLSLSFLDLVDVFVAGQLREQGVTLQTVRRTYEHLQDRLATPHPFCRKELLTDGKAILIESANGNGGDQLQKVFARQGVFARIIKPGLQTIDYNETDRLAERWHIAPRVVLDPTLSFGKPVVEGLGIATAVLAAAYHGNGRDAEVVADWFNINASDVIAAVNFESNLAT